MRDDYVADRVRPMPEPSFFRGVFVSLALATPFWIACVLAWLFR